MLFQLVSASGADPDALVLEDFQAAPLGKLPPGWNWKRTDEDSHKPYMVMAEGENRFLAARDNGESVILGKEIEWDIHKYPYLSFRWRVRKIPAGGDERFGDTNDSAAAVYVIYRTRMGLVPQSLKYIWSSTNPVGSASRRSGIGRPWAVVADSGTAHLGQWRTHVFNVLDAYRRTFGDDPPEKVAGIAILSDANSTRSQAHADYDDIRVLSRADAGSGIDRILDAD